MPSLNTLRAELWVQRINTLVVMTDTCCRFHRLPGRFEFFRGIGLETRVIQSCLHSAHRCE